MHANLGSLPFYTWRSICAARGLLRSGLCWHVGRGDQILIREDAWIPGIREHRIQDSVLNNDLLMVSDLIHAQRREWKDDLVKNTFSTEVAVQILHIPLSSTPMMIFRCGMESLLVILRYVMLIKSYKKKF